MVRYIGNEDGGGGSEDGSVQDVGLTSLAMVEVKVLVRVMIEVKVLVRVTVKVLERVVMWRFMCWWGISGGGGVSMEEVKELESLVMAEVLVGCQWRK
jgi:hypothetical protein